MEYSLFNRQVEQNVLPVARELGIDVVAFGILAHGLLSGAWTKERVERGDVARNAFYIEIFQKGNIEKNILLVEELLVIAKEKQVSLAQLIYAWSLTKGRDIVPIIGASKAAQFEDSILARDIILTPDDISRIEKAVPADKISGRSFPH
jgi:Predicted oxidoreductases (related to aryl-alcohol dehydrogenases)